MSLIKIKQINNEDASNGSLIVYHSGQNFWSNNNNKGVLIPSGTTSERPSSPTDGFIRYNTTLSSFEFYENGIWKKLDNVTVSSLNISGASIITTVSGNNEILQRTLVGGGIVEISTSSNGTVIISAAPGSLTSANITLSSLSTSGFSILTNTSSYEIHQRQIVGDEFITIIPSTSTLSLKGLREVSYLVTQSSHGFSQNKVIYLDNNDNLWKLAISTSSNTLGVAFVNNPTLNSFEAVFAGILSGFNNLQPGNYYFVSDTSAGEIQINEPSIYSNPILYAVSSTIGMVLPYRPSETVSGLNFSITLSGLGPSSGANILRNVENNTEIVYKKIVSTSSIIVQETTNSIELSVIPQNINIPVKFTYFSGNFDTPNNVDWKIENAAASISDPSYNSLTVRNFPKSFFTSASPYRGVGGIFKVPDNQYKNVSLNLTFRPSSSVPVSANSIFHIYFRKIPNFSPVSAWIDNVYNIRIFPDTGSPLRFQYNTFVSSVNLSSLGLVNNSIFQFEIVREYDNINDTLTTGIYVLEFGITFT